MPHETKPPSILSPGATHRSGHVVAVKCLDKEQIEKQRMGKQLKREIAIMKLVDHPRVVRFHEVLASKTKIYLVLEVRSSSLRPIDPSLRSGVVSSALLVSLCAMRGSS